MNKAVLIAAALLVAPLTLSGQEVRGGKDRDAPSTQAFPTQKSPEPLAPTERADEQSEPVFKDRVADAIEAVEDACAADIDDLCGRVSAGEGRIALCMLAHEDALSARCRFGLYRAARKLRSNVGEVAEGCLREIQALCGETGRIRQCLEQKRGSLSSSCQTIVGAIGQRVHRLIGLMGATVYSSDNKNLGQVVEVIKGPDDKVQSIQVDIGRLLGLGTKVVTITADKFEQLPGIKLLLPEKDVRALPEATKP
jgi:PRC-barrel domain protein